MLARSPEGSATGSSLGGTILLRAGADLARAVDNTFVLGVALLSLSSLQARHAEPSSPLATFAEVIAHWHRLGNWTQRRTLESRAGAAADAAAKIRGSSMAPEEVVLFAQDEVRRGGVTDSRPI